MITFSKSLSRRMASMIERAIGSGATLHFYAGAVPESEDTPATEASHRDATKEDIDALVKGDEPRRDADYAFWRLYDIGGLVLFQGDWT